MMAFIYHLTLLFGIGNFVFGKAIENDCGTLTIKEPAVKHRPVTFTFVPSSYSEQEVVTWWRLREREGITNTSNISIYKHDSVYYLRFSNTTDSDEADYYVLYVGNSGGCRIDTQLTLAVLTYCGMVYQRTERVISGTDVEIGYLPPMSVVNNPDQYIRYWLFRPVPCADKAMCSLTNITSRYTERELENNELVLTIPNINSTMNGIYLVQCMAGSNSIRRTNGAMIHILASPNKPTFANTRDFDGCERCVYGTFGDTITIGCNTANGSEPVTVNIFVAQTKKQASLSGGTYIISHRFIEHDHMTAVKCEVVNAALNSPLVVLSKLYIVRQPRKPEIRMYHLKEDQPINVSCTSKGGRPAANVTMYISEKRMPSDAAFQTQTLDISSTFTTNTVMTYMKRGWNGKRLKCCASHETLAHPICSKEESIYYKFPPASVAIQPLHPITEYRPNHLVNVTCVVANASPSCQATWQIHGIEVQNMLVQTYTTTDNGHTTTNMAFLNVSTDDSGKTLVCKARCKDFDIHQYDSYIITVPTVSVTIEPPQPLKEDRSYHLLNLTCVIKNVMPACPAAWSIKNYGDPNIVTKTYTKLDNVYTTTNVAVLNVSKDDNGKTIECRAKCKDVDLDKSDTYLILVPQTPFIKINISTSTVNAMEGSTVVLQCTANSYPISIISWIKRNHNTLLTEYMCGGRGTMCMRIEDIHFEDGGVYTCLADNRIFKSRSKDIEIIVKEHQNYHDENATFSEKNTALDGNPSQVLWPILGALTIAVIFLGVGLAIKWVLKKTANGQIISSIDGDPHLRHIDKPSRHTHMLTTPPDGLYVDFNAKPKADIYDVIRDSKTNDDDDACYIHPVSRNDSHTPSMDIADISQDVDGDYIHPVSRNNGNTPTMDIPDVSRNVDEHYLYPVDRECNTINTSNPETISNNIEENRIYDHIL